MDSPGMPTRIITIALRLALVGTLVLAGWLVYRQLPNEARQSIPDTNGQTTVQLVLRQSPDMGNDLSGGHRGHSTRVLHRASRRQTL
jgi:hypothetical protein